MLKKICSGEGSATGLNRIPFTDAQSAMFTLLYCGHGSTSCYVSYSCWICWLFRLPAVISACDGVRGWLELNKKVNFRPCEGTLHVSSSTSQVFCDCLETKATLVHCFWVIVPQLLNNLHWWFKTFFNLPLFWKYCIFIICNFQYKFSQPWLLTYCSFLSRCFTHGV